MNRILKLKVKNAAEFEAIKRALELPDVRAFVTICGHLEPLSKRAQARILNFVADEATEKPKADTDPQQPPNCLGCGKPVWVGSLHHCTGELRGRCR